MKLRVIFLVVTQTMFTGAAWAYDPVPLVITPPSGTNVTSGSQFVLHVDSEINVGQMRVEVSGRGILDSKLSGTPPMDFTLSVPWTVTGPLPMTITATSYDSSTGVVRYSKVHHELFAKPAAVDVPVKLGGWSDVSLRAPSEGQPPDVKSLSLPAEYADGRVRDVSFGSFGTTYLSSNPSVVTVSADGDITPVSAGTAFVRVEYLGLRKFVEVNVRADSGAANPPTEYTGTLQIYKGGFRRDPATGIYTQQVTITNNTAWPIAQPIHLVLGGLTQGVSVSDGWGSTRNVQPLGMPIIFGEVPDNAPFLLPGKSITTNLKFENLKNLPISYTLRVFGAGRP